MAAILQSPGEWMIPLDKDRQRRSESDNEEQIEPRGDPEMAPLYLRRLLPVFCTTFQSTMLASVRKASLGLIKKMIHYIQPSLLLEELCSTSESAANNFGTQLVEVIATVLDNEVYIFPFPFLLLFINFYGVLVLIFKNIYVFALCYVPICFL